jgi:hypothetical protein
MRTFSGAHDEASVLERIDAMRRHEDNTARCIVYITPQVNATCRRLMVDWFVVVANSFDLRRETVNAAMSILDRYLSSQKGELSQLALTCRVTFQKVAITSFFVAMKIHEPPPFAFGLRMLLRLGRGLYVENDIISAEIDILSVLEWRVSASIPSPMEYVRHYLDLLPREYVDLNGDDILHKAATFADVATSDVYYSTCRSSHVGLACLAMALDGNMPSSSSSSDDREAMLEELMDKLDWMSVADREDMRHIEKRLLRDIAESSDRELRITPSNAIPTRTSIISACGHPSSPGSVARIVQ